MLGKAQFPLAGGAGALLAVNIVCINLSADRLLAPQIKPRTWLQRRVRTNRRSSTVWSTLLVALLAIIYLEKG